MRILYMYTLQQSSVVLDSIMKQWVKLTEALAL